MLDPNKIDKYLYVNKTPTWKVRAIYSFGIISWLLVLWGFSGAILYDPFYKWFVAPILGLLTLYLISSYLLNLFYKQFDIQFHLDKIKSFWSIPTQKTLDSIRTVKKPSVDVYLPICGEDILILKNTWYHVSRLKYSNKKIYVFDDSKENCENHKHLAEQFGFTYLQRPNRGEMKKAGNLKYAFERTNGEFIAIFDADFAPHQDFLLETLPYFTDKKVGIVQTPQYFETTKELYSRSRLEYGAAYVQEDFYRIIQVARDRLGGALCCGSNAVYRRQSLETIGGPLQVQYSEDSRTGVALVSKGWTLRYLPIILAVGLCPEDPYPYFHQQHRWCSGSMELTKSKKEFWNTKMPFSARACYLSGFSYYLHHPLTILLSFQLFFSLFFYNDYISLLGALPFYPYLIFSFIMLPLFHKAKLRLGVFTTSTIQVWAYTHAILTVFLGQSVSWVITGSKHSKVSPAFQQTMNAVRVYVTISGFIILFAIFIGYIHFFNLNYYSVQFWLFYNMILSTYLFWQMRKYYKSITRLKPAIVSI